MRNNSSNSNIKFDLLENGLDFVLSALDPILKNQDLDLKYSILHLSAGIELILKDRLRREHWSLIFENINSAKSKSLISGDFQSVNLESCLTRLQEICNIPLTESEISIFRELKKRRNKIEHFVVNENSPSVKSIVSNVLSAVLSFIVANFDQSTLSAHNNDQIEELRKKIGAFKEFVDLRLNQISKQIEKALNEGKELIKCPKCYQKTFLLDDTLECLFCGYSDTPENVAQNYIESVLEINSHMTYIDGGHYPLDNCPECDSETLVHDGRQYICFSCHMTYNNDELTECETCGTLYLKPEDDIGICEVCINNKWHEKED